MRKLALLAIMLLCCISGAAFAQDAAPTYCGSLSDADCAIVTGAQDAMKGLDSVSFDLSFNLNATNIPDVPEPVNFSITGNGSVTGMQTLQGMADMTDMSAFTENLGGALADVLSGFDADLTFVIALPAELMGPSSGMPSDITLQIRMVDGVGYLNLDPLQPLLNSPSMQGWYGLDIANLVKALFEQMPDMTEMMNMEGMDMSYMEEFNNPELLSQFVTITRTDNGSGDVATFETSVDLGALMSSPEFQELIQQQMQAQMEMQGQSVTEEEMAMGMAMSAQMMQGMVVNVTEEIGLSDGFLHSVRGTMTIDTAAMMAAISSSIAEGMGGTSSDDSAATEAAPLITIDFSLDYSDFGTAAAITAPEDATVLPYEMVLQGMMGSMGSGMSSGSNSGG
jgi:hypothetical protein